MLLVQAILLGGVRLWFYSSTLYTDIYWQFFYFIIIAILTAACARRIGIMHYIEAIFTAVLWLIVGLIIDALITAPIAGLSMFSHLSLWLGYFIMMLSVFFFHKKRHVQIRHEHAAHRAHGHH